MYSKATVVIMAMVWLWSCRNDFTARLRRELCNL